MRKWIWFATVALVLAMSGSALAEYNPNGEALPASAVEASVWELTPAGQWAPSTLARLWNSGSDQGYCNKAYWETTFTSHASVAQWINWSLGGTRKDWRILKPGTYGGDCIAFTIASNNAVVISFADFADLQYLTTAPEDTLDHIASWYGVALSGASDDINNVSWVTPDELNDLNLTIPNSAGLHQGLTYKIWQKLQVANCNSSSEYEDAGRIGIAVTNLKFWVDGPTGAFAENQLGNPPTTPYAPITI